MFALLLLLRVLKFTSLERILSYIKTLPPEETPQEIAAKNANYLLWKITKGDIVFKDACMRYADGLPLVLKSCNIDFKGGLSYGIVGRTGAGKSSLTVALFRIVELASGVVTVDGVDISRLPLRILRQQLAIIPQDPVLFQGTIRTNIDPFHEYDDDAVWDVLQKVSMADFFRHGGHSNNNNGEGEGNENKGLKFVISDNGDNLSVGERQLIAIARVLLKNPRVLVLDEASSSVDSVTDQLIQTTIQTTFLNKGTTVIIIAHRPSSIIACDCVVVMADGEVVEMGSPQQVTCVFTSSFPLQD